MNVGCFLVTNGEFKQTVLPQKPLLELIKSLRKNGKEKVHFPDYSIEVEGVYIPARNSETRLLCITG